MIPQEEAFVKKFFKLFSSFFNFVEAPEGFFDQPQRGSLQIILQISANVKPYFYKF